MERSETDIDKGTVPPKPVRKTLAMGSFPVTDKGFLEWHERQETWNGVLKHPSHARAETWNGVLYEPLCATSEH
jgi:hypothetical protein